MFYPNRLPILFLYDYASTKKILKCTRKPEACDVTARTQHFRYDLFCIHNAHGPTRPWPDQSYIACYGPGIYFLSDFSHQPLVNLPSACRPTIFMSLILPSIPLPPLPLYPLYPPSPSPHLAPSLPLSLSPSLPLSFSLSLLLPVILNATLFSASVSTFTHCLYV